MGVSLPSTMKILFIIDPIEKLHLDTDSTIEIMNECAESYHTLYYAELKDLFFTPNSFSGTKTVSVK